MNKALALLVVFWASQSFAQDITAGVATLTTQDTIPTQDTDSPQVNPKPVNPKDEAPQLDINNFELVEHALYSSVVLQNIPAIKELLPIYQQKSSDDKTSRLLIKTSQALLAKTNQDIKQSIRLYREVLAENPNLLDIRFTLAELLYQDQQNEAAKDQFLRLRGDERASEQDKQVLDAYLTAINKKSEWVVGGNVGYAYDPNANDIPKKSSIKMNGGTWTFPAKEVAKGIQYRAFAQKSINLKDNLYLVPYASLSGKSYYTNHQYDDTTAKLSLELALKDTQKELGVSPYAQKRYSGGEPYNQEVGVSFDGSYWFTPKHQSSLSAKIGNQQYEKRLKELNSGNVYEVNGSHLWLMSPNQYVSMGLGYGQKNAQDPSRAYKKTTLTASWTKDWQGGLSTNLTASVGKSHYQGKDIVGIQRQDTVYDTSMSVWHKNIHFWGITPRLTVSYSDTHSNHPFYEIAKSNAYVQFSKKF